MSNKYITHRIFRLRLSQIAKVVSLAKFDLNFF